MSSFCGSTVKPHCFTGTKLIALITKVCVLSKDILCRIGVFVFVLFCLFSLFFFFNYSSEFVYICSLSDIWRWFGGSNGP